MIEVHHELHVLESCDACGSCCRHVGVPPFRAREQEQLPAWAREEYLAANAHGDNLIDQPCYWFDRETLGCRHYDLRPQACRDFERGSEGCHLIRGYWSG